MFGLGAGEILIILVIAFLLFGPKQLPEVGRQVGKAVKGFKETADDLRKSVEPEINMIQQEVKTVEQDFQASMKEAEEEVNQITAPGEKESVAQKPWPFSSRPIFSDNSVLVLDGIIPTDRTTISNSSFRIV